MEARDKTRARGKVRFDGCPRIILEIEAVERRQRKGEREREREKWRAWLICISEEPRVGHRPGRGVTEAGLFASLSGSWPAGKDTRGASLSNDRSNFDDGRRLNGAREFCSRREGGLFEGIDSTNVEQMEEILSMNFRWRVRIIEIDWSTRPQVEEDIIDIFLSSNELESKWNLFEDYSITDSILAPCVSLLVMGKFHIHRTGNNISIGRLTTIPPILTSKIGTCRSSKARSRHTRILQPRQPWLTYRTSRWIVCMVERRKKTNAVRTACKWVIVPRD